MTPLVQCHPGSSYHSGCLFFTSFLAYSAFSHLSTLKCNNQYIPICPLDFFLLYLFYSLLFLCKYLLNVYLHHDLFPDFQSKLDMYEIRIFIFSPKVSPSSLFSYFRDTGGPDQFLCFSKPSHQPSATGSRLPSFTLPTAVLLMIGVPSP